MSSGIGREDCKYILNEWEKGMTDEALINEVAQLWVDLGRDAEGVYWCWQSLYKKVAELEEEREDIK